MLMQYGELIKKMTLEEKAALLGGKSEWESRDIPRLEIPSIVMSDGPHGVRRQAGAGDHLGLNASLPATCFPTAATMANSWDPGMGEAIGEALGEEAKALGVDILLGPGMNIKRNPLCGRNFEYFSEDPYLSGKMAASYVKGIQKKGVHACLKHFAVNSQEERRMAMNAVVDERTLREIYLTGFEMAIEEAAPGALMTSYNQVNGEYANENTHLLKDILRGEWGYEGLVVSDWGGSNDAVAAAKAGSDLEMPAPGFGSARQIVKAVRDKVLDERILDQRVDEILRTIFAVKKEASQPTFEFDKEAHHALARMAAAESAVLLKNEEKILPLKEGTKVAVIGDFAFEPRCQGAGSSVVNVTKLETIKDLIKEEQGLQVTAIIRGYRRQGEADQELLAEAIAYAREADVVLYFFGLDEMSESEGLDRTHMAIPENQVHVLKHLYRVNPNIVGVLSGGSAIEMPWAFACKAILHCYLGGQAGAGAALDLLCGRVNPSGKLAETYPMQYKNVSSYLHYPAKERNSVYREGIYIGYRYFEKVGKEVRYPFGYGLSYTTFAYSGLKVTREGAGFTITNTGDRDGAEIAQLYVGKPDSPVYRPVKELKGFLRVELKAGESREVFIPFDARTFRYWNVDKNGWSVERGNYTIWVGGSSDDTPLEAVLQVGGEAAPAVRDKQRLHSYFTGSVDIVSDIEYEMVLRGPIPDGKWSGTIGENDALCQLYYAKSRLGRFIYRRLDGKKKKAEAKGKPDLNTLFIYNMPFRAIAKMSGGMVDTRMVRGMVQIVNGRFFTGFGKVIGGFIGNQFSNMRWKKMFRQ